LPDAGPQGIPRDASGEWKAVTMTNNPRRLKSKSVRDDEALRRSEERNARLLAFMNRSPSLMFIKDLEGRYLYVNERFAQAFGLESKDIISHTDFELFSAELATQFRANDTKVVAKGVGIEVEETAPYGDGFSHTSIVHKFPLFDSWGQVTAVGGIATDITERKRLEEELKQKNVQLGKALQAEATLRDRQDHLNFIATHDPLTGLPNRALLHERAEHAIAVARRSGHLLALLFIDLDRFKTVNDSLGHAAGDSVLRQVATRFSRCLREVDMIARHGGDEFVVLLEDVERAEEVEQVAGRMQEALVDPLEIDGEQISVTGSIGVALYPRDGDTASTLLQKADLAMYRAKELGRKTVQFYGRDLDLEAPSIGNQDGI
jgi:diguanylate cyclase (GGDEF)-like protein/PAS domain S-box-containing protein